MRMLFAITCAAVALAFFVGDGASSQDKKDEPKYTIKEVMLKAHKGKGALLNKVKDGTATEAESKELLEMYKSMAKCKQPKGDDDSWKKKTTALVEAATLYVGGKKDDGVTALNAASNCAGCHKAHKG